MQFRRLLGGDDQAVKVGTSTLSQVLTESTIDRSCWLQRWASLDVTERLAILLEVRQREVVYLVLI